MGTDTSDPATDTGRLARGWTRYLIAAIACFMAILWGYALFGPRGDPPGTMDSPEFAQAAEPICAEAQVAIADLPLAFETPDAVQRAGVIQDANAHLETMIAELRRIVPQDGEDARRVEDWLTDWETFLGDREAYAAALAVDADTRFLQTEKGGNHLSEALDFFAVDANGMPSCATPTDVG